MEKDIEGPDARYGGDPPEMDVYLFVWDRFRMIAKDFILQLDSNDSGISASIMSSSSLMFLLRYSKQDDSVATINERVFIDKLCIECHERMCRWHIMMEHHMAHNGTISVTIYRSHRNSLRSVVGYR
jgi:SAC3/GANP family